MSILSRFLKSGVPRENRWLHRAGRVAVVATGCLLVGCESPPRTYPMYVGPERERDEVARLSYAYPLTLDAVDGKRVTDVKVRPMGGRHEVHLLPGEYELVVRHKPIYMIDEEEPHVVRPAAVGLRAVLEPGRAYRLQHRVGSLDEGVHIWMEDVTGD